MAQIKKLQKGAPAPIATTTAPDTNNITYKGVNFDKNALINSYKDYLKTTAQNNVTGFQQADQYKDIDEHLNRRIGDLQGSTVINENQNFTTAPTQINGITGLNTFLDSGDKSKSQQFENEAFYNFLDKSVELNKQTSTATTPSANNYHRFNSIIGSITNSDYAGKSEGFSTGWSTATPEAKKARVRQALVSELTNLKNAGDKEIIGLDAETAAKLRNGDADKYITEIPGATDQRLAEIAGRLGLNTELAELLQADPAETEAKRVTDEAKTLADATLHQNNVIQHEKYLANQANNKKITDANLRRRAEAAAQNKQFAINKLKRIADAKYKTTGGASFKAGTGPNGEWTEADSMDALALAGDVASFGGTIPAIAGGLTSTGATLRSDYLRGKSGWEMAGNVGMNLGFTALALIPGLASVKMGVKSAKAAHALKLIDKAAEGAEKTLKVLKSTKVLTEAQKAEKIAALAVLKEVDVIKNVNKVAKTKPLLSTASIPGTEALTKVTSKLPNILTPNIGKIATGIRKVAAVGGLYSGYEGLKDTGSKVLSGNAEDINLNDARNLIYGAMAARGINRRIQKGAAYEKVKGTQIETAGSEVSLKGVNSELKGVIPDKITVAKGQKPQEKINEIFDSKINPKKEALAKLDETNDKKAFDTLKKEIELLESSKVSAEVEVISKLKNLVGIGKTKDKFEKSEWKLKTKPTESSIHSTKYQQKMIDKANSSNNKFVKELSEMNKVTDKKFGNLNRLVTKSKHIKSKNVKNELAVKSKKATAERKISKKQNGGLIPTFKTPAGPLQFLTTPTSGFPWEASLHKNDLLRKNPANWIKRSSSLIYDYKAPTTPPESPNLLPEITVTAPKIVKPGDKPVINTFIKPTLLKPVDKTLNIPSLAEPIKYLAGQATNKQNLKTALEHLTPVLETPFQKTAVDKNWLPIQGQANRAAVETQRLASRPMTSDANLQMASNFEGAKNAAELRAAGNDKAWGVQEENKQNTNLVANENAQLRNASANKNLSTIAAHRNVVGSLLTGKRAQDYANLTELINATTKATTDRNIIKHEYDINKQKQGLIDTYKGGFKKLSDEFENQYGTSGENKVNSDEYKAWEKQQSGLKPTDPQYYSWDSEKNAGNRNTYTTRMEELQRNLTNAQKRAMDTYEIDSQGVNQYYDPTGYSFKLPTKFPRFGNTNVRFKEGGKLSAGEKYEIEILKLKQRSKEHGDKTFQKTMDRKDKSTAKILDGLSKEKLMLLKTVLGVK